MNLKSLSKEQKQAIFLVAMLAFGGIYALYRFVLVPSQATFKESKAELRDLRSKLEQADIAISGVDKIKAELRDSAAELKLCNKKYIPPIGNPLAWTTRYVYDKARDLGLDIESVDETSTGPPPWGRGRKTSRVFVPYAVRVVLECGYFDLVTLIEGFESSNPYLSVVSIGIGQKPQSPETHRVTFVIEWPSWFDASAQDMIRGLPKPKEATTEEGSDA